MERINKDIDMCSEAVRQILRISVNKVAKNNQKNQNAFEIVQK